MYKGLCHMLLEEVFFHICNNCKVILIYFNRCLFVIFAKQSLNFTRQLIISYITIFSEHLLCSISNIQQSFVYAKGAGGVSARHV